MRRIALAALGVAASLATADSASAQGEPEAPPILASSYGGGWAGRTQQLWLRAEPAEGGQALQRVFGLADTPCGTLSFTADAVPAPGGAFDTSGRTRDATVLASWRLRGTIAGAEGRGTLEANVQTRRRGRTVRRCKVQARPWVLATGSRTIRPATALEWPPVSSRWNGTTDGKGIFSLLMGSSRRRIDRVLVGVDMTFCPRRRPDRLWVVLRDVRVDEQRQFRTIERFVLREGGVVRRLRVALTGSFDLYELEASVDLREVTRRAATGARVSACQTGSLSVEAAQMGATSASG